MISGSEYDNFIFTDGIHLELNELLGASQPVYQLNKRKRKLPSMASLNGQTRSRFRGQGMEFEEVRSYLPGDDIRNIDWRVTARTGKAHTKVFTEDREQLVFGILNQHKRLFFGSHTALKSVIAAHHFANLLNLAREQGHRVGAFLFDDSGQEEFKPSNRRKHLTHMLAKVEQRHNQQIAEIENQGFENPDFEGQEQGQHLTHALTRLLKVTRPGSEIHIITDIIPQLNTIWEPLSLLSRHNQLHVWSIVDELDWKLPDSGNLSITNGRSKSQLGLSVKNARDYLQNFVDSARQMQDRLWKTGAQFHLMGPLPTALNLESGMLGSNKPGADKPGSDKPGSDK